MKQVCIVLQDSVQLEGKSYGIAIAADTSAAVEILHCDGLCSLSQHSLALHELIPLTIDVCQILHSYYSIYIIFYV